MQNTHAYEGGACEPSSVPTETCGPHGLRGGWHHNNTDCMGTNASSPYRVSESTTMTPCDAMPKCAYINSGEIVTINYGLAHALQAQLHIICEGATQFANNAMCPCHGSACEACWFLRTNAHIKCVSREGMDLSILCTTQASRARHTRQRCNRQSRYVISLHTALA